MKDQNGFSLIEVIIAMAVFSILALVLGKMTIAQQQTVAYLEDKIEVIQLKGMLSLNFVDQKACDNTLKGMMVPEADPVNLNIVNNTQGQSIYQSNSELERVDIGQIFIQVKNPIPINSTGVIEVTVPVLRKTHGGGPTTLNPVVVPVMVALDNSRKVASCLTSGFAGAGIKESCPTSPNGQVLDEPWVNGTQWYGMVGWSPNHQYSGTPIYKCVNGGWVYVSSIYDQNIPCGHAGCALAPTNQ